MTPRQMRIPLFPMHTVLFPGATLELRIFEPRYLDMISRCMREGDGFGVCLIRSGKEVGEAAVPYHVGTFARIIDWRMRDDGLLGVSVRSEQRLRLLATAVQPDQLLIGDAELLAEPDAAPITRQYLPVVDYLRDLIYQTGAPYLDQPEKFDDACWVSYRLAELLPIDLEQRQHLLQLDDAIQRLERLRAILECLDNEE